MMYEHDGVQIFQALDPHFGLTCTLEPIHSATTRHLAPSKLKLTNLVSFKEFWRMPSPDDILLLCFKKL